MTLINQALPQSRFASVDKWARLVPPVLFLLALIIRHPNAGNTNDVSWLITIAEKIMHGKRLYVDIIEVNPPASLWLYFPFVALAHLIHVSPELLINLELLGIAGLMVWLSAIILQPTPACKLIYAPTAVWGAALMLIIVPAQANSYAQREQFGVMFILPMLALVYARLERVEISPKLAIFAGLCAGIAMCIKPYFAAPIGLPMLIAAMRTKSIKPLFPPEFWIASAVVLTYMLSVYTLYPEYFSTILPLISVAYLPVHDTWSTIFIHPAFINILFLFVISLITAKYTPSTQILTILLTASLGAFLGLVIVPHKSFFYHYTPAISLSGICVVLALSMRDIDLIKKLIECTGFGVLQLSFYTFLGSVPVPQGGHLAAAVARIQPHPTLLEIGNYTSGFPLTRKLQGDWVGSLYVLWVAYGAHLMNENASAPMPEAQTAALNMAKQFERNLLLSDVARQKPQIILVQTKKEDWRIWIGRHPDIAAALAPYTSRGIYDNFEIMQRTVP